MTVLHYNKILTYVHVHICTCMEDLKPMDSFGMW